MKRKVAISFIVETYGQGFGLSARSLTDENMKGLCEDISNVKTFCRYCDTVQADVCYNGNPEESHLADVSIWACAVEFDANFHSVNQPDIEKRFSELIQKENGLSSSDIDLQTFEYRQKSMVWEEMLSEIEYQKEHCELLFNTGFDLNKDNERRTPFTQMTTSYMAELLQSLGYMKDCIVDISNREENKIWTAKEYIALYNDVKGKVVHDMQIWLGLDKDSAEKQFFDKEIYRYKHCPEFTVGYYLANNDLPYEENKSFVAEFIGYNSSQVEYCVDKIFEGLKRDKELQDFYRFRDDRCLINDERI